MTFDEFQTAVQGWAEARGIYEHSTPVAQALKAVSEVGEVADAVIKGQRDELIDGIGDVAVCLVNLAHMAGVDLSPKAHNLMTDLAAETIAAFMASYAGKCAIYSTFLPEDYANTLEGAANDTLSCLIDLARSADVSLEHCCEVAWNEISDRKGRMVPGGAFVKEED